MRKEIEIERQSSIANQKQMLTNLNGATMSANALTPRGSQEIDHQ